MPKKIHKVTAVNAIPAAERARADGFVYALPRTVLLATVNVQRTSTDRAVLANAPNAEDLAKDLGLSGVNTQKSVSLTVLSDGSSVVSDAEADPDQTYLVDAQLDDSNSELMLQLSSLGVITSASAQLQHKSIFVSVLKGVIGVAAKALPVVLSASSALPMERGLGFHREGRDERRGPDPKKYYDEVKRVREARFKLISGETPGSPSDSALERMLKELDKLEAKALSAFTGAKKVELWKAQFVLRPDDVTDGRWTKDLLTLHPGRVEVLAEAELSNPPPLHWVVDGDNVTGGPAAGAVSLSVQLDAEQIAEKLNLLPRLSAQAEERSFWFRVPAVTDVALAVTEASGRVESLAAERMQVAQLGGVFSLPRLKVKSESRYELEWHETLGSLKKVLAERDAGEDTGITQIAEAAEGLAGAFDQKSRLQREVDLLELQVKRKDAQDKLLGDAVVAAVLESE